MSSLGRGHQQKAKWPLPATPEPAGTRCYIVTIPDDPAYIAAFRGAMYELAKPYAWGDDEAHTALTVGERMQTAYDGILEEDCALVGLQTQIRTNGDCGLEWSYDNWETFSSYDPTTCINGIIDGTVPGMISQAILDAIADGTLGTGNSGAQSPQSRPASGTCRTYHVRLIPGAQWICPSPIIGGDTIQITNIAGGWSIGELAWYCGDGARYLFANCNEELKTKLPADPFYPDAFHMQLIGKIISAYFDPLTVYTYPLGLEETNFQILANTSLTASPSGEVTFDVTVCTGAAWCWYFDFALSNQGFVGQPGTTYGTFAGHLQWGSANVFTLSKVFVVTTETTMDTMIADYFTYGPRNAHWQIYDENIPGVVAQGDFQTGPSAISLDHTVLPPSDYIFRIDCTNAAGVTLANIRFTGRGENPFGVGSC